jgi:hypothetical protein
LLPPTPLHIVLTQKGHVQPLAAQLHQLEQFGGVFGVEVKD